MEKEDKIKMFQSELNLIHDDDIREQVTDAIEDIDDYFFSIPASSTGKYHPAFALGDGGLVRHTKACVKIAVELLTLEMFQSLLQYHVIIIAALIFHDCKKNGDGEKYTKSNHPLLACDFLIKNIKIRIGLCSKIVPLIQSHMGQWNTDFKTGKVILPKPITPLEKFVHLCDYLASRKFIEIKFE